MAKREIESDDVGMALLRHDNAMERLARRLSRIDLSERLEKAEKMTSDVKKRDAELAEMQKAGPSKKIKSSQF